jgi:hypothetical protein
MKKLLLIINTFLVLAVLAVSCKKTGIPEVLPTSTQEIASVTLAGSYYIENSPSSEFKIPVGTTTISDVDRTINFTYTSSTGAANGVQYTAPASVTIPKGKAVDTLRIKGIFTGYPTGRKDNLKIKITGGSLPTFAGKDSFLLTLQGYCSVSLAALGGNYDNTLEYGSGTTPGYGPYTIQILNVTSTGATSATAKIANIYDDSWGQVNINFDWLNPAAFKVTIPLQSIGRTYSGTAAYVRTSTASTAVNTFSSCDNSITISIDIVNSAGGAIAGQPSNYKIILKK